MSNFWGVAYFNFTWMNSVISYNTTKIKCLLYLNRQTFFNKTPNIIVNISTFLTERDHQFLNQKP